MTLGHNVKPLGQSTLTMLVVASMVGAGVYTTSGFAMYDLRDPWLVLLAWGVGGCIAICGATGYSLLAHRLTENGGEYLYLSRFVHPAAGFMAGWVSFLAGFTGAGAYAAVAFETYAVPIHPDWLPPKIIALALVTVATIAHASSTHHGVRGQNFVVSLKLVLLGTLVLYAFACFPQWKGGQLQVDADASSPVTILAFATSVMWISLSYCGFNAAIYVAGETHQGARSVGRAMIWGTVGVTVLYLLLNAFFVFAPAPEDIAGQEDVAAIAARAVGGKWLETVLRVAVCLGLATSVSSVIMAGPRVYAKMADDGCFPRFFASQNPPPRRAIILQGIAIAIVVQFTTLQSLLSYLGMTLALSAAATVGSLFVPVKGRDTQGSEEVIRAWENLPARILAAVYVVATIAIASLTAWNKPYEGIAAVGTLFIGAAVYFVSLSVPSPLRPSERS